MEIKKKTIKRFILICGESSVHSDINTRKKYSKDKTNFEYVPDVVVIPSNTQEISELMKICYKENIPVTPMARASGLSGGALAIEGGVLLSVEKLDDIIEIDENNYQITVEPYVKNFRIQEAVKEKGLFYPPDPASYRISSIGGNVAENAGGPKSVKYGCTKDYVLSLEMVLSDGNIINTGSNVLKNASGYNLTQLVVGSEGTLGIITKITLRLIPYPKESALMFASFKSLSDACKSVNTIMNEGIVPSALELMERTAILYSKKYCQQDFPPVTSETESHLLIELDGNNKKILEEELLLIKKLLEDNYDVETIYMAKNEKDVKNIWTLRRNVYLGIHKQNIVKEMDVVVPRAKMADAIKKIVMFGKMYGYETTAYGHAGDGNLHIGIINKNDTPEEKINTGIKKSFESICKEFGGTLSGEHGIGISQKKYMQIAFSDVELKLMKEIKKIFDPKNILNPGKIF